VKVVRRLTRALFLFINNPISWGRLILAGLIAKVHNPIKYRIAKRISRYERALTEICIFLIHPVGLIYLSFRFHLSTLNPQTNRDKSSKFRFKKKTKKRFILEAQKIGEINKDGLFIKSKEACNISSRDEMAKSLQRERSKVEYFVFDNSKIVRKEYKGAFPYFRIFNELRIQKKLKFKNIVTLSIIKRTIYLRYQGESLHSILTSFGANLKNEELYFLNGITAFQRDLRHLQSPIIKELLKFHHMGVTLYDLNYANILVDDELQKVSFVDFESARIYRHQSGSRFMIQRDRDREKLNRLFGFELPTYRRIKSELQSLLLANEIYAPISLGYGLCTPGIFDRNLGFGKFHYSVDPLIRKMPNNNILSLGTNNSSLEFLIAAKYGSKITCLEISKENIIQAKFFLNALEWSLNKELAVELVNTPIETFDFSQNSFDLVLFLCSIYYLEEPTIRVVLSKVAQNSKNLMIQLNTAGDIGRDSYRDYELAAPEYFLNLLPELDYVKIQLHEWKSYSRPIITSSSGKELFVI